MKAHNNGKEGMCHEDLTFKKCSYSFSIKLNLTAKVKLMSLNKYKYLKK